MGWLAVNTSTDWGFSIDITANAATNTYTSAGTETNAVQAMDALAAWANDGARGWTGVNSFTWSARIGSTGRAEMVLASNAAFTITPDAAAIAALGIAVQAAVTSTTTSTGAAGTWYPANGLHLRNWLRQLDNGDAASLGSLRPGVPGSGNQSGTCEAVAGYAEIPALVTALRAATQPRTGQVYHDIAAAWQVVSIGPVSQERLAAAAYRVALTVKGVS